MIDSLATVEGNELVTSELRVSGMDCASCAAVVERSIRQLDGIDNVDVDVVGGRVRITHARGLAASDLAGAVDRTGYRVAKAGNGIAGGPSAADQSVESSFWTRRGRILMALGSGIALLAALLATQMGSPRGVVTGILALSTISGGWYVIPRGVRAAMNRALDMNFLMSIAAAGAWIIGEEAEAAATLFLFAVAELLESFSMERARHAFRALMELSPAESTVVRSGREERVRVEDIVVGETIVVRPGERIGVDGEVLDGRSSVDQASITGESMPVDKESGSPVFAGTMNVDGVLWVKSQKAANDTTLARIIHSVQEAQSSRAPSQTLVDRFARVYTPAVVAAAVLLAIIPPLAGVGTFETWIYRALAMLVVACPCALVISTPVSIVSGLTGAARGGVLIKGGAHLENAGRVTTLCFDKTGTLTSGQPAVTEVVGLNDIPPDAVLRYAAAVEQHSEHPLGRAIVNHALSAGIELPTSAEFRARRGVGAEALVEGKLLKVGSGRLVRELGIDYPEYDSFLERAKREGNTAVIVSGPEGGIGMIALADQLRAEARDAVRDIREAGVQRIVMLTGDNAGAAQSVAAATEIEEYYADLMPQDKLRIVREREAAGERVAFVGDGVNDAPALAAATVGVAMGAAGSDAALETADIALMGDDLRRIAFTVRLSRRTLTIIRQNIAVSIAIKGIFLILAVTGVATLWMAVAADMGASLLVVANGLRALRPDASPSGMRREPGAEFQGAAA